MGVEDHMNIADDSLGGRNLVWIDVAHVPSPFYHLYHTNDRQSIPQWPAGLERVGDALLRFALAAEREEMLAFEIAQILCGDRRARRDVAAAENFGEVRGDGDVVVAGVFALV